MSARYAFAAHPEALADLREAPDSIRDLALLELQHLVHGHERSAPLKGRLAGCHKVYVDPRAEWRLVVQYRDAPAGGRHQREIYLLAVGKREEGAAYRQANERLERTATAQTAESTAINNRAQAARARSPHLHSVPTSPTAVPTRSAGAQPADHTARKSLA